MGATPVPVLGALASNKCVLGTPGVMCTTTEPPRHHRHHSERRPNATVSARRTNPTPLIAATATPATGRLSAMAPCFVPRAPHFALQVTTPRYPRTTVATTAQTASHAPHAPQTPQPIGESSRQSNCTVYREARLCLASNDTVGEGHHHSWH
jgi:hypothetical protein